MPGNTPRLNIPYPVGTDRVMDGDNNMQDIATRLDDVVIKHYGHGWGKPGNPNQPNQPKLVMITGLLTVTFDAQFHATITFPTPFPTACIAFFCTALTGAGTSPVVDNGALTNLDVRIVVPNLQGSYDVSYLAIGY